MFKTSTNLYCDCCGKLICANVSNEVELEKNDFQKGYDYNVVEGMYICAACDDAETIVCSICDKTFFADNMVYSDWVSNGEFMCKECFATKVYPDIKKIFDKIHDKKSFSDETLETLDLGTNEPWRVDPVAARMANY